MESSAAGEGGWLSVGVDVGGTFTDLVAVDAAGRAHVCKVLSTPADQSEGVLAALDALGRPAAEVARIVHGTTVATNALLERTGARVALCATAGHADVLELRRQDRASLFDLARHHPPPLVAAGDTVGVAGRQGPHGELAGLAEDDAHDAADRARATGAATVAVCLLHAYADPAHERRLATALGRHFAEADVVLSSEVLPEVREYERAATTAAEAYLRPGVARYLARLAGELERRGFPAPAVMTSAGGLRDAADAGRAAAALALSGPAGGVAGAALVAAAAGFADALTIDIGGTSADAGLVLDGEPLTEAGGRVAGVPIALPRVLVETVSAGGGSIGWVDEGGALRVGPRSAGSRPGPAAFGQGGTEATVTDAHLVLGNVRAARLSGGVRLDAALAHAAVGRLAARLGATPGRTARAMLAAADAAMARALRRVSVERGVDPRRCVLVALGGGGPLHACALAELLGIRRVLAPPLAGVLSALGLAVAAPRRESLASVMRPAASLATADVAALCDRLAERAAAAPDQRRRWWLRMRYAGQGHELEVPVQPGDDGAAAAARFAVLHAERYGFVLERDAEVVSARHAATGEARPVSLARAGRTAWDPADMADDGRALDATVRGRAAVALPDATLLVPPGWTARALPTGGWLVERDA